MPRSLSSIAVLAAIRTGSYAQVQLYERDALVWRYVLSSPPPSPPPAPRQM